jgi:hypothetical protein
MKRMIILSVLILMALFVIVNSFFVVKTGLALFVLGCIGVAVYVSSGRK